MEFIQRIDLFDFNHPVIYSAYSILRGLLQSLNLGFFR